MWEQERLPPQEQKVEVLNSGVGGTATHSHDARIGPSLLYAWGVLTFWLYNIFYHKSK